MEPESSSSSVIINWDDRNAVDNLAFQMMGLARQMQNTSINEYVNVASSTTKIQFDPRWFWAIHYGGTTLVIPPPEFVGWKWKVLLEFLNVPKETIEKFESGWWKPRGSLRYRNLCGWMVRGREEELIRNIGFISFNDYIDEVSISLSDKPFILQPPSISVQYNAYLSCTSPFSKEWLVLLPDTFVSYQKEKRDGYYQYRFYTYFANFIRKKLSMASFEDTLLSTYPSIYKHNIYICIPDSLKIFP